MKNKEWLKEALGELDLVNTVFEPDGVSYIDTAVSVMQIYDLIDQLEDAEKLEDSDKVAIPKFVADWWERDGYSVTMYGGAQVKKKHKLDLVSKFHDKGLGDYLSKVEDWLDENDSAFLDLVNGKPYEIEKEKLYYIKFSENQYAQKFDETKFDSMLINEESLAGKFTKEEIQKINPNLIALAVEVEVAE